MVSMNGDEVRSKLDAFLAYAATEDEPSEDGLQLWDDLARSVEALVEDYWPATDEGDDAEPSEPEQQPLTEPPVDQALPRHARAKAQDGWLVASFQGINGWNRQPGDPLTVWQRVNIAGAIISALVVTGALIYGVAYFVLHVEDFVITDRPGQPR